MLMLQNLTKLEAIMTDSQPTLTEIENLFNYGYVVIPEYAISLAVHAQDRVLLCPINKKIQVEW